VSADKGWGKTVLGWFVVRDEEDKTLPDTSTDETDALLAKYAGVEEVGEAPVPTLVLDGPSPPLPVDFSEVFSAGGVEPAEQECMKKAAELLGTLPADTPTAVKKQIVEAALRVFGFPITSIIEAGVAEMEALDAFLHIGQDTTKQVLTDSAARIDQLQAEIAGLRALMEERLREQEGQLHTCNAKKLEIQKVLEFFGPEAVAQVVRDSPRLHEPSSQELAAYTPNNTNEEP